MRTEARASYAQLTQRTSWLRRDPQNHFAQSSVVSLLGNLEQLVSEVKGTTLCWTCYGRSLVCWSGELSSEQWQATT